MLTSTHLFFAYEYINIIEKQSGYHHPLAMVDLVTIYAELSKKLKTQMYQN